ncbi:hypothetical protein BCR44DRAFT_39347 [Catenaria anguillulae PL171]|uniref:CHCH domain-containing protein n=1 Tax=Catenaria anguillulae PL171 TaxID=765915 RepID=A0A1Y2HLP9_9FUNG|nr:hypothetical protein BCR44DRAFT_39347 [Catenaria anguillulae PL171]
MSASAPRKYLQLRPRAFLQTAPCAAEMTALFNCWSASGIEGAPCKEAALNVSKCIASSGGKGAAKGANLNQQLTRLQIPAVNHPRRYR